MEELILLHLLEYNHLKGDFVVPESLTEKGLQRILNCNLGHICRTLKKNENKGYLYRTLMHVENKKRKLFVFFLTPKEIKVAEELRNMYYN